MLFCKSNYLINKQLVIYFLFIFWLLSVLLWCWLFVICCLRLTDEVTKYHFRSIGSVSSKRYFLLWEWMDGSFVLLSASTVGSWSHWRSLSLYRIISLLYLVHFRFLLQTLWWTLWTWAWAGRRWTERHWNRLSLIFVTHLVIVLFVQG